METKMDMLNKVLYYRERKEDMSQEKLAELVGVSQKTICNIEQHTHIPNVLIAMRLAQVLNVDIYELFKDATWRKEK